MALKEWKKKNRKEIIGWSKKQGSFWQGISIYHNREWEVEVIDFKDSKITSPVILEQYYFKTKTEANRFAREYMQDN